eukprot:8083101-Alexandrium_andersonii.AAC.1
MQLQGFPAAPLQEFIKQKPIRADPDILIADMAGNAFSGTIILFVILGILLGAPEECLNKFSAAASPPEDDGCD